jgi:hypothetical protein
MKKVTLHINRAPEKPGHYLVVINGEGFTGSVGKSVGARFRGDDTFSDDSLFNIVGGFNKVGTDGRFTLSQIVPGSKLNEDWGQDEVYALVDVQGAGTFTTNTVTGSF